MELQDINRDLLESPVTIEVKESIDILIEEIAKDGISVYFKKLKMEMPTLPLRDLTVKNLTYSIKVREQSERQDVSNFIKDSISIIKSPFIHSKVSKKILDNINLDLKSGSTTIVLKMSFCRF